MPNSTSPTTQKATLSVSEALSLGDLDTALNLGRQAVRSSPANADARLLMAELSLIAGDLEKSDLHADAAGLHRAEWATGLAIFRAQLRGLHARDAFYRNAALPAFAGEPTERDRRSVRLVAAMAAGDPGEIAKARTAVMDLAPTVTARVNDGVSQPFSGLDDRILQTIECIMASGDYLRIDADKIDRIVVDTSAPRRPKHLVLRPATIILKDGGSAECAMPALYPSALRENVDPLFKLGQGTDWRDENGVTTGIGQVCWLVGNDVVALQDIEEVCFDAA